MINSRVISSVVARVEWQTRLSRASERNGYTWLHKYTIRVSLTDTRTMVINRTRVPRVPLEILGLFWLDSRIGQVKDRRRRNECTRVARARVRPPFNLFLSDLKPTCFFVFLCDMVVIRMFEKILSRAMVIQTVIFDVV